MSRRQPPMVSRMIRKDASALRFARGLSPSLLALAVASPPKYFLVPAVCTPIFALFVAGRLRWLRLAPLAWLGAISYALYLLHQSIGFVLIHWLEHHGVAPVLAVVLTVAVMFGLATALNRLVERPALQLIRTSWQARSRTALEPAASGADA